MEQGLDNGVRESGFIWINFSTQLKLTHRQAARRRLEGREKGEGRGGRMKEKKDAVKTQFLLLSSWAILNGHTIPKPVNE